MQVAVGGAILDMQYELYASVAPTSREMSMCIAEPMFLEFVILTPFIYCENQMEFIFSFGFTIIVICTITYKEV